MNITDVEKAQRVVDQLSHSHRELQTRAGELSAERAALSFAALAEADKDSQTKLKRLNTEAAHLGLEIENVSSALNEAGKRLHAAQQAEALEAKREQAVELRKVTNRFAQRAIDMDASLQKVAAIGNEMQSTLNTIHSLGASAPSHNQLTTLGSTTVKTALMSGPFRVEHIAPGERRTFGDLFVGWIAMLDRHAAQFIGPEKTEEAA
jgi:hypothetical protein